MRKGGDNWKDEKKKEKRNKRERREEEEKGEKLLGVAGLVGGTGGKWQWWWCTRWPPLSTCNHHNIDNVRTNAGVGLWLQCNLQPGIYEIFSLGEDNLQPGIIDFFAIAKDCLLTLVKSRLALGSPGCLFDTMPKMALCLVSSSCKCLTKADELAD